MTERQVQPNYRIVWIVGGLLALFVVIGLISAFGGRRAQVSPAGQYVTIDGRDSSDAIIDPINVWDDYQIRGAVVARLPHGARVKMLRRDGSGIQIETENGVRGWVTDSFIRELK